VQLIETHPTLMKRPLIADGDTLHLGWTKDVQAALNVS
jgi:arsenate reductase